MANVIIDGEELSKEDKHNIFLCISCRLGFIETGEISLRATDAIKAGMQEKVKALTSEQKLLTVRLEQIMHKML